ncbi:MAG: helix-turn-helix domain-containing protein [Clostridia bacterium]|nr:helix-turn-helix domain-containing protein [Clostridia bacterium]
MFEEKIGNMILEVSHKLIPSPSSSAYQNHIHNYCELLLFISGDADFNIDGQMYSPKPYDLFLIPEATYHYIIPRPNAPYENYVIDFSPVLMNPHHYQRVFTPPYKINIYSDSAFLNYFHLLDRYSEIYTPEDFRECALLLIREMLVYCSYQTKLYSEQELPDNRLVRLITDYISENITAQLNAEIIAKHFFLSKSYVQNVFSSCMHIGLKQYILQKKIFAAHSDLERGATPGEVCKKYHFNDYTGFYRLYKKLLGAPPKNAVENKI